jgi:hypothetical protein
MKKIREDKPTGVIIHIYMEISHGNSLCTASCLSLKLKYHVFCFIPSLFSPTKSQTRRAESESQGQDGSSGRWKVLGKGGRRMNTVQ